MTAEAAGVFATRPGAAVLARIGPNAVLQLADALESRVGRDGLARVFADTGQGHHLRHPPGEMVDERSVTALYTSLPRLVGWQTAAEVSSRAGRLTADYLLAHRIPRVIQHLLRCLPARSAAQLLTRAISRHAWTFAGSGVFTVRKPGSRRGDEAGARASRRPAGAVVRPRLVYVVHDCPVCRGSRTQGAACSYYAATFEGLFARLVHPGAQVREARCQALGDAACEFEISW